MTHRIGLAAGLVLSLLCGGAYAADPPALSDVPEHVARDGVLSVTLETKEGKTDFGGVSVDTIAYNGVFAGQVLRVWPGDMLRVLLRNRLNQPTNLHFQGIQTSPLGDSDNVHLAIQPGEDFGYEVKIPAEQPPGTYWYHAHMHGFSERQVGLGLSGRLIVEGLAGRIPGLANVRERQFVLKTVELDDSDDPTIADEWPARSPRSTARSRSRKHSVQGKPSSGMSVTKAPTCHGIWL